MTAVHCCYGDDRFSGSHARYDTVLNRCDRRSTGRPGDLLVGSILGLNREREVEVIPNHDGFLRGIQRDGRYGINPGHNCNIASGRFVAGAGGNRRRTRFDGCDRSGVNSSNGSIGRAPADGRVGRIAWRDRGCQGLRIAFRKVQAVCVQRHGLHGNNRRFLGSASAKQRGNRQEDQDNVLFHISMY